MTRSVFGLPIIGLTFAITTGIITHSPVIGAVTFVVYLVTVVGTWMAFTTVNPLTGYRENRKLR